MASLKTMQFCLMLAFVVGMTIAQEASEDPAEDRSYPAAKKPAKLLNKKKPSVIAPGYRPVSAYGAPTPAYPSPTPAYPSVSTPAYPSVPTPAAYQAPAYAASAPVYPSPAPAYPSPAPAYAPSRPSPTPSYKKPAASKPSPVYQQAPYPSENRPYQGASYQGSPASYQPVDGRVKIQAYRGPNKDYEKDDSFAPWGFFVNQPADN